MRSTATRLPSAVFGHLSSMTDTLGLFEHAEYRSPRISHGYCTDDVARGLTVVVRERGDDPALEQLVETYLDFVEGAITSDGSAHNRMAADGRWTDEPTTDDCWGRAVGGLGAATRYSRSASVRQRAHRAFLRAARGRTTDVRSAAFAAIGAADVLHARPDDDVARALLIDCLARVPTEATGGWVWPELRLRYANAALCDALIVGGAALDNPLLLGRGMLLLSALLEIETGPDGHLSPTGSAGRTAGELGPLWDQQPIEVAAIADACAHAHEISGDPIWSDGVDLAWAWFCGENDLGVPLYDPETGAGHDGLHADRRNENCGAESTLAALGTLQRARECAPVAS